MSLVGQSVRICNHILRTEGLKGLYRGYFVSLSTYGSNSAFYWAFYYLYSELLEELLPRSDSWMREQLRIVSAGLFSSVTAVMLTNPLDVVRTRYQLQVSFVPSLTKASLTDDQLGLCMIDKMGLAVLYIVSNPKANCDCPISRHSHATSDTKYIILCACLMTCLEE